MKNNMKLACLLMTPVVVTATQELDSQAKIFNFDSIKKNLNDKTNKTSVLEIRLLEGENIPDNISGYSKLVVYTEGDKKLDDTDFLNINNSNIREIDLSNARADIIPERAFYFNRNITSFKLPMGLIEIGNEAFESCSGLKILELPDTLETIGNSAFESCSGFTGNLIIPDSVRTIGDYAFFRCSGFNGTLTLPDSITSLGAAAFSECSKLTGGVRIPLGVTHIPRSLFSSCSSLNGNITIHENVETIGEYAFYKCSRLTGNIVIPDSVTSMGRFVFYQCTGLNGTLTIGKGLTTIPYGAFSSCSKLTGDLTIPDNITTIEEGDYDYYGAFYGCSGLNGALYLSENLQSIPKGTFQDCYRLTGDINIPDSVTEIRTNAFRGCYGFDGNLTLGNGLTTIRSYAFHNCKKLSGELILPSSLKTMEDYAFAYCAGFTGTINIPDNVTSVGEYIFYNCSGFERLGHISSNIRNLTKGMFAYCSGLKGNLVIPDTVTSMFDNGVANDYPSTFEGCSGFDGELIIGSGLKTIPKNAFKGLSNLKKATIPENITTMRHYAFSGCTNLESIDYLGAMPTIESTSFSGCSSLSNVTLTDKVTSIPANAFRGCINLSEINIPSTVTSIGDYAFYGCSGLTNLTLPSSLNSLGKEAFYNCRGLTGNLVIPESLIDIGNSAFFNCEGLTGLTLPSSLERIGNYAFYNCSGLTGELTLPSSLKTISSYAFSKCSGLEGDILIPDSVTGMGSSAFDEMDNVDKIIVLVKDTHKDINYRKSVIEYLPIDKTYIEMSNELDISGTWLDKTGYIKAMPIIHVNSGKFENGIGVGVSLNIIEASPVKTINILKNGEPYSLDKTSSGLYTFSEAGTYQVYIETELGTISNLSFENVSPINKPTIELKDNKLSIVNNGILSNVYIKDIENFDDENNLKLNLSNSSWTIVNGELKSETIAHSKSTENQFSISGASGEQVVIKVKTSSENNYDWGYIYLNGKEVYKKSGNNTDYDTITLDLVEGENIIKFKYSKDSGGTSGSDAMFIDSIEFSKQEIQTLDCETIEYRINNGDWITYTDSIDFDYPSGTVIKIDVRAKHNDFVSEIYSETMLIGLDSELNFDEIEDVITKAEETMTIEDLEKARAIVNNLPEIEKKAEFQRRLNAISIDLTLEKKSHSSSVDVYIKSENMLSMSLSTNQVTFDNYSGVEDTEKLGAVNITINSSLPYTISAYMPNEITNSDNSSTINLDKFNIRENTQGNYKQFENHTEKLVLKDNCDKGNGNIHVIDMKLSSNDAHKADIYKTVIKFEAEQK